VWQKVPALDGEVPTGESGLLRKLSEIKTYSPFVTSYHSWLAQRPDALEYDDRVEWLKCILFFAEQDTDGDGVPDWTALIDGNPSRVLYPQDSDIDGDGTDNVLDPAPFNAKVKGRRAPIKLPAHVKDSRPEVAVLQATLFRKFGILAINHTDRHSPAVLRNLLLLLEHGFTSRLIRGLGGFRYIYAFAGHDARINIAAYHAVANAISIGGMQAYPADTRQLQLPIIATLAHEIGHAFLMHQISPGELKQVSENYGDWREVFTDPTELTLYSAAFFTPHPRRRLASIAPPDAKKSNLISGYAATNIHEWFADAFAAAALLRMGEARRLGQEWRERLVEVPSRSKDYWVNYNNLSDGLLSWIRNKLRPQI